MVVESQLTVGRTKSRRVTGKGFGKSNGAMSRGVEASAGRGDERE